MVWLGGRLACVQRSCYFAETTNFLQSGYCLWGVVTWWSWCLVFCLPVAQWQFGGHFPVEPFYDIDQGVLGSRIDNSQQLLATEE